MITLATLAADVVIGIGQGQPQVVVLFGSKRITIKLTAEAPLVTIPLIRILTQIEKRFCFYHLMCKCLPVHRGPLYFRTDQLIVMED